MIRRRHLFTMLRGARLPRRLGSCTIQTRHPRRYPTPVSGWNRNEPGGAAGRGLERPLLHVLVAIDRDIGAGHERRLVRA
jgi:hypothetical protein